MTYQITTLPNGLRVASERLEGVQTAALAIAVDVGARYETPAQHGISHLLEHMAFKGTATRSALDIAITFDAIGGHLNAYTSHEHTVYYAKVLAEHLPLAAEVLCDIIQHSTFDEQELEREKQVIVQELAMYHDTPDDLIFDQFQEAAFANQALGRTVLGTQESICRHTADDLRAFVAQHYTPDRLVISAAGNVDHDALVAMITQHYGRDATPVIALSDKETGVYSGSEMIVNKPLEQLQLIVGVESIPIHDARYYTLQLLSTLLGGGMSSRLFQEIREKRGLVYTVQTFNSSYSDSGVFGVYAATGEEQVAELIPVIAEQWQQVCEQITQDELDRAKQQHLANLCMARESTSTVAEWIGRHLLQFGEYRQLADITQQIEAITVADVQAMAQTLFINRQPTVAALGPTGQMVPLSAVQERLVG